MTHIAIEARHPEHLGKAKETSYIPHWTKDSRKILFSNKTSGSLGQLEVISEARPPTNQEAGSGYFFRPMGLRFWPVSHALHEYLTTDLTASST